MGHLKSALSRSIAYIRKKCPLLLKEGAKHRGGLTPHTFPSLIKEGWRGAPGWLRVAVLYTSSMLTALESKCPDLKLSTIAVP